MCVAILLKWANTVSCFIGQETKEELKRPFLQAAILADEHVIIGLETISKAEAVFTKTITWHFLLT